MAMVPIEDVSVGAVLARPIEDSMGRILINAGESLTEQLLAVLKKRGFTEIEIRPQVSGDQAETEALEEQISRKYTDTVKFDSTVLKIKQEFEQRFHNVPANDKPMQIVRLMAQKVVVDQYARKQGA